MITPDEDIRTLEEVIDNDDVVCLHRDTSKAKEPMINFKKTEGAKDCLPMSFWASWELADRPRRIALLMDDCQEEYRPLSGEILPQLQQLVKVFREKDCPIAWSAWSRTYDDGISNSMDRWYGPRGLDPKNFENALYIADGAKGMRPLKEIAPTDDEINDGWFYHGKHLDMFWVFDKDGKSYLDEKLKDLGIDTIVIAGLWTDECILSTAFAGSSRGYDVIIVSDAVSTATTNQEKALTVANGTVAKVLTTQQVVDYLSKDYVQGEIGAVKGIRHPDGRKDNHFLN